MKVYILPDEAMMGCQAWEPLACIYLPVGEQLFTVVPALKWLGFTKRTEPGSALGQNTGKYHRPLLNTEFLKKFFFFLITG